MIENIKKYQWINGIYRVIDFIRKHFVKLKDDLDFKTNNLLETEMDEIFYPL
jgi:hypothetical protein